MTESDVATIAAIVTAVTSTMAAAYVGARWWLVSPDRLVWPVIRTAQAIAGVQAVVAGGLAAAGYDPAGGLYWLYALLPVAIGVIAEQLRIAAAEQVLELRELPDAQAIGALPEDEQRSVVLQIVRREIGVMAIAAGTVAFLALRAALIA